MRSTIIALWTLAAALGTRLPAGAALGPTSAASPVTTTTLAAPDDDLDGVPDAHDRCPHTATPAPVLHDGCSVAQRCPCATTAAGRPWRSHGRYARCVAHAVRRLVHAHRLAADDAARLAGDARTAACGAPAPILACAF